MPCRQWGSIVERNPASKARAFPLLRTQGFSRLAKRIRARLGEEDHPLADALPQKAGRSLLNVLLPLRQNLQVASRASSGVYARTEMCLRR